MNVSLINYTTNAEALLIFTKSTRLNMSPSLLSEISDMPFEEKEKQLAYMADTIPSSWEFVHYTFLVSGVSRAYTHQQVRTRAASYAQQSMRVLDLSAGFSYVYTNNNYRNPAAMQVIDDVCEVIRMGYRKLIEMGQPPEDARGILPTNIATNIVCDFNLRTLSELVKSRSGGRTQDEYQAVVAGMAEAVLAVHPWAERFLFPKPRDYFAEIEQWAAKEFPNDLLKKGELLKIVDKMRKG